MKKTVELKVLPKDIHDETAIRQRAIQKTKANPQQVQAVQVVRRSIDARGRQPFFLLRIDVFIHERPSPPPALLNHLKMVNTQKKVIIVGAGPAGYFAALELIEQGLCPILFDRGKDVQARRRDLRAIQQLGEVNPHSNYCFGEGGAGTYSDGKLYTRSHKRGNIAKALQLLVEHGANSDILIDAHPHIGSNKLPKIVANIRATIQKYGGEVHFDACMTDLIVEKDTIKGVVINGENTYFADAVILATGHSARDVYSLLYEKKIAIEAKPFALGVRVEHPQSLIDELQYSQAQRDDNLPAASYRLACQADGRGVFSFCMCPGGLVVPASTAPGEIVVNGMSLSRRDSPYANSGTVVSVELEDLVEYQQYGVLAGLKFQESIEQTMFAASDGTQKAPALRMTDFVEKKLSLNLPATSYIPGLVSAPLYDLLPEGIYRRLAHGMRTFGTKMKGYYTADANVIGTESRTSSPIRIPRDKSNLMHIQIKGLFPCGEGAGYAGGIISAAMDGQNVAKAVRKFYD